MPDTIENIAEKAGKSNSLATELTLGRGTDDERTYEILPLLGERENPINGHEMIRRAKELAAHLGADHRQFFLDHQAEIPPELRCYIFAFTDDTRTEGRQILVSDIYWRNGAWKLYWSKRNLSWNGRVRVLRRVLSRPLAA